MAFVLVHGGGFTSACWRRTLPHLRAPARAIDLPGRGESPADPAAVRLRDWVAATAEAVRAAAEPVVLVGHSLAGITLPGAAHLSRERIRRLVFVSCTVPPEGGTVLDTVPPSVRQAAESSRHEGTPPVLSADLARALFCNDMDEELERETIGQMVPEATAPLSEPISLAGLEGIPCVWIKLLRDAILPPARQEEMASRLPGAEVVELDAGHMAMISAAERLAAILNEIHRRA